METDLGIVSSQLQKFQYELAALETFKRVKFIKTELNRRYYTSDSR